MINNNSTTKDFLKAKVGKLPLFTSSTNDPTAIFAALGVWTSCQIVSESAPHPPHARRSSPLPPSSRTTGLTPLMKYQI